MTDYAQAIGRLNAEVLFGDVSSKIETLQASVEQAVLSWKQEKNCLQTSCDSQCLFVGVSPRCGVSEEHASIEVSRSRRLPQTEADGIHRYLTVVRTSNPIER